MALVKMQEARCKRLVKLGHMVRVTLLRKNVTHTPLDGVHWLAQRECDRINPKKMRLQWWAFL